MAIVYGVHKYNTSEALNLQLGQAGFDVVGEHDSTTQSPPDENGRAGVWIALQCLAAVTPGSTAYASQFCQLTAACNEGDDLTSVFLQPGDIIYGSFFAQGCHRFHAAGSIPMEALGKSGRRLIKEDMTSILTNN